MHKGSTASTGGAKPSPSRLSLTDLPWQWVSGLSFEDSSQLRLLSWAPPDVSLEWVERWGSAQSHRRRTKPRRHDSNRLINAARVLREIIPGQSICPRTRTAA